MKFEEVSTQLIQIPNSHNGFYSVRSIPNLSLLRIVAKYPQRIIALLYICLAILNKNTICFVNSQSFRMTRKTNLALRTNSKHTQVSVCMYIVTKNKIHLKNNKQLPHRKLKEHYPCVVHTAHKISHYYRYLFIG